MKIIKIVFTRCQILRLKCTKLYCGWGFAPDTAGATYSTPADSLVDVGKLNETVGLTVNIVVANLLAKQ